MIKLNIDEIVEVIKKQVKNKDEADKVLVELQKLAEEKKQEKEDNKSDVVKTKNSYYVVIVDDTNLIPAESREKLTAFVIQQPTGVDSGTILSRISDAAREQNETRGGKKAPLLSMIECFGHLKRKFIKSKSVLVKTKEPVRCIVSSGKLV